MSSAGNDDDLIYVEERNAGSGGPSIVFLHGAGTSHLEWAAVAADPALADYHLLLVDLPRHSASRSVGSSFSLPFAADQVAEVIRRRARGGDGRAHVVGFSLGGFAALVLAARHPGVLLSVFVTGAFPFRGAFRWFAARPRLLWAMDALGDAVPGSAALAARLQGMPPPGRELAEQIKGNRSFELTRDVYTSLLADFGEDVVEQVARSGVRVCAVAGAKMDQLDAARDMARVLTRKDASTAADDDDGRKGANRVVVIRDGYHQWFAQFPHLFAEGLRAWVEGEELPAEFASLD